MDPAEFGISTLPLQHAPYDAISRDTLAGTNKGKVAIITGAQRGIGAAIAESLAASGADVALLDLTQESLAKSAQACDAHGGKVKTYACDVTDEKRVKEVLRSIETDLGAIECVWNSSNHH